MGSIAQALIAVSIILVLILMLRFRRPETEETPEETRNNKPEPVVPVTEVKLPSGQVLTNEEVLKLTVEELCKFDTDDLKKLVDYAGHRMYEADKAGEKEIHDSWGCFFELASGALYGYL